MDRENDTVCLKNMRSDAMHSHLQLAADNLFAITLSILQLSEQLFYNYVDLL